MTVLARIDRNKAEPLYRQVEAALLDLILHGDWAPGTQVPTEDELVRLFNVSRVTVQQAMRNLAQKGYLVRSRGKGSFVRLPTLTAGERGLRSFTEEMQALGLQPGSRLLSIKVILPPEDVAEALDLRPDDPVVQVRRLRTGNGLPIGVQTAHLPVRRFPTLADDLNEFVSLYDHLWEVYQVRAREARETFLAEMIPVEDAELLQVGSGTCGFRVERLSFNHEGPFEFTVSIMRGDRYRLQWVLKSDPKGDQP